MQLYRTVAQYAVPRIQRGAAWVRGLRLRTRVALLVVLALVGAIGGMGWATAPMITDTRQEARLLLDEVASLEVAQLLEPGVYAELAEQSGRTELAMGRLRSRLGWFRPLEVVPFLGGRVRSARNTAQVGLEVAGATQQVATVYGEVVTARRDGGLPAVQAALGAHSEDLTGPGSCWPSPSW